MVPALRAHAQHPAHVSPSGVQSPTHSAAGVNNSASGTCQHRNQLPLKRTLLFASYRHSRTAANATTGCHGRRSLARVACVPPCCQRHNHVPAAACAVCTAWSYEAGVCVSLQPAAKHTEWSCKADAGRFPDHRKCACTWTRHCIACARIPTYAADQLAPCSTIALHTRASFNQIQVVTGKPCVTYANSIP